MSKKSKFLFFVLVLGALMSSTVFAVDATPIVDGKGEIKTLSDGENKIRFLIVNNGTLTINDGVLENSGIASDSWYTIYSPSGMVNLNGGIVRAKVIDGKTYEKLASAVNVKNKLNINGGNVESDVYGVFSYDTTVNIKMTGGTIIANKNALYIKGDKTKGKVQILGGTIVSTEANGIVVEKNECSLVIGNADEVQDNENPLIKGKKLAVSCKNAYKFYDGKLVVE